MIAPNGALTAVAIFELMSRAEDWRPVSDPRTPMAFALAPGWVFKSNLSYRRLDRDRVAREVVRMIGVTATVGIWHPAKTWFLLCDRRRYLACSATPRLLLPMEAGWRRWISLGQQRRLMSRAAACGVRLDWKPYNFGYEAGSWRLYYLDDEVYPLRRR